MRIKLVPTYNLELELLDSSKRDSFLSEQVNTNHFYLKLAPFFVGATGKKGDKGKPGENATGNFLSTIDW